MTAATPKRRAEDLRRVLEALAPKDAAVILQRVEMIERRNGR